MIGDRPVHRRSRGFACIMRVAVGLCVLVALASRLEAQTNVAGPKPAEATPRKVVTNPYAQDAGLTGLSLIAGIFESYDSTHLNFATATDTTTGNGATSDPAADASSAAAGTDAGAPVYWRSGLRTGANAAINYTGGKQGTRGSVDTSGQVRVSAFTGSKRVHWTGNGNLVESLLVGRRTTLRGAQSVTFAPFFSFGTFAGLNTLAGSDQVNALDPEFDFAVYPSLAFDYMVNAGVTRELSKRASLSFDYMWRYRDYRDQQADYADREIGGRFRYQLSRGLGAHMGYRFSKSNYVTVDGQQPIRHDLDVGLDYGYGKGIALSRRTTFSFSSGSSILSDSSGSRIRFNRQSIRLTGSAAIRYDIGRTWNARLAYHRGWDAVQGFANPFFTDTVSAGFGGSLSRRTTLGINSSYLHASIFSTTRDDKQTSYVTTAMLRYSLTRRAYLYAQGNLYRYEFSTAAALPLGLPEGLDRRSVRVGLSLGVPLMRSEVTR